MALAEYNVLKLIGKGTYGEVHLVTHKRDKKQYVIKKLEFMKASRKERESAELEAKLLSTLRHPNIVSYKDSFQSESGHLYIVMGFADGGDLYTRLREHRERKEPLGEQQIVRWYIQICMALQYLHEKRILHRDLKTQNIFLTKTQIIKVGDLGIAKVLESANDMATTLIGTPYYMSPELFSNRPYNQKSDVWALGCCMYEMVTLRHAFNAKDINSLMYKILKGKMPTMPEEYSSKLCNLIRDMLNQNPDKRPSVSRILRNPFIKMHIQLFLDESSKKRKAEKSRKSSNGSKSLSRKTSANSQGSSPSPHPPFLAPDPTKPSRPRARSPNVSPPSAQATPRSYVTHGPTVSKKQPMPRERNLDYDKRVPEQTRAAPPFGDAQKTVVGDEQISYKHDVEISAGFVEPVKVEKVEVIENYTPLYENKNRVTSASSSGSASSQSSSKTKSGRPLPDLKSSSEPSKRESSPKNLNNSGESVVSVVSSVANSEAGGRKSARQRRRESKQKENQKKPAIIEEIRKSRSTGFKHRIPRVRVDQRKADLPDGDKHTASQQDKLPKSDAILTRMDSDDKVEVDGRYQDRKKSVEMLPSSQELQKNEEEVEDFINELHTTLHIGSGRDTKDEGDSPISVEESGDHNGGMLSPVMELTEGSSKSQPVGPRMTPVATRIHVPDPSANHIDEYPRRNISQKTLRSTQRLMDRIVALRKECIRGLGVPLLHQAYEVLDRNHDDNQLQEDLTSLLGHDRFEIWSGKIWQLKYCEESLFGHCDSITTS